MTRETPPPPVAYLEQVAATIHSQSHRVRPGSTCPACDDAARALHAVGLLAGSRSWSAGRPGHVPDPDLDRQQWTAWLDEHDARVAEKAWDEGHRRAWRRGPDTCSCYARSAGECGCGNYGTGPLLSLDDNPYRATEDEG